MKPLKRKNYYLFVFLFAFISINDRIALASYREEDGKPICQKTNDPAISAKQILTNLA